PNGDSRERESNSRHGSACDRYKRKATNRVATRKVRCSARRPVGRFIFQSSKLRQPLFWTGVDSGSPTSDTSVDYRGLLTTVARLLIRSFRFSPDAAATAYFA